MLKERGILERALAPEGIKVRWVQSLGSNKALEFLNAGSIDFGSTAGAAALVGRINGNPITSLYVYSRPEWTALVTRKDSGITQVSDLKGKRIAVTRGLIDALDDQELEAVLGHELTHIRNGDVKLMVVAVIIAGVITLVGEMVFRGLFNSGGRRIGSTTWRSSGTSRCRPAPCS